MKHQVCACVCTCQFVYGFPLRCEMNLEIVIIIRQKFNDPWNLFILPFSVSLYGMEINI